MKPVLLLLASLVLLVLVFLSGVVITANVIAEPEPHKFANVDTPDLWTTRPKPVDPSKQSYERVPPAASAVAAVAETAKKDLSVPPTVEPQPVAAPAVDALEDAHVDPTTTASIGPQPEELQESTGPIAAMDPAHAEWCFARYRSYRVEDNSYQPFGGGPRRQCQAPGAPSVEDVAAAPVAETQVQDVPPVADEPLPPEEIREPAQDLGYGEPPISEAGASVGAHEEWCFARYRSYRVEDNSYQPFDGGPRRDCQSPYG